MLRTSELEYELPEEQIAVRPPERRDDARLLVTGRGAGARISHHRVHELVGFLRAGDLLVFNSTHVAPARLIGVRRDTGGRVEGLFLADAAPAGDRAVRWRVLLRAKRMRVGCVVDLERAEGDGAAVTLTLEREGEDGPGSWVVLVKGPPGEATDRLLGMVGRTPLPPYILGARKRMGMAVPDRDDRARYQTVYARAGESASVAAPTAGLHFTPELLAALGAAGVERAEVTLHVGTGTFKPVETEYVEEHPIHAEWFRMDEDAARAITSCRERGGRVIAVGTTSARAVESVAGIPPEAAAAGVWTRLLVTPGYRWQRVDGLLTNFHLPRSTLMAMVAALLEGGASHLRAIYACALAEKYRFYSYGDAMLILP